jgi:hypothetical protein
MTLPDALALPFFLLIENAIKRIGAQVVEILPIE